MGRKNIFWAEKLELHYVSKEDVEEGKDYGYFILIKNDNKKAPFYLRKRYDVEGVCNLIKEIERERSKEHSPEEYKLEKFVISAKAQEIISKHKKELESRV